MLYKYIAYTPEGERVERVIEAPSERVAEEMLWQSNLTIVKVEKRRQLPTLDEAVPTLFGVKPADVVTFSRQMSTILESGIGILQALEVLQEQAPKASFKRVLRRVIEDLQTGTLFSEACAKHPTVFPPVFLRLMKIGEGTGNLALMLKQAAEYMEKQVILMRKLRNAMAYPAVVMVIALFAVFVLLNFVLPALSRLFREFGGQLPLITRLLLQGADFLRAFIWAVVLVVAVFAFLVWRYSKTRRGSRQMAWLLLSMPLLGNFLKSSQLARLTRSMTTLFGAGVSVTESLDLTIRSSENTILREALEGVRSDILAGKSLSEAFQTQPLFPRLLGQMIAVGEETGRLAVNVEGMATFYEEEADRAMSALLGIIEPALIISIGGFVGFIGISVITPIYSLIQQVR